MSHATKKKLIDALTISAVLLLFLTASIVFIGVSRRTSPKPATQVRAIQKPASPTSAPITVAPKRRSPKYKSEARESLRASFPADGDRWETHRYANGTEFSCYEFDVEIKNNTPYTIEAYRVRVVIKSRLGDYISEATYRRDEPLLRRQSEIHTLHWAPGYQDEVSGSYPNDLRLEVRVMQVLFSDGNLFRFEDRKTSGEYRADRQKVNDSILGAINGKIDGK